MINHVGSGHRPRQAKLDPLLVEGSSSPSSPQPPGVESGSGAPLVDGDEPTPPRGGSTHGGNANLPTTKEVNENLSDGWGGDGDAAGVRGEWRRWR